jgi:precorrin-6B methylase 2
LVAPWEVFLGFAVAVAATIYFFFGSFIYGSAGYQPTFRRVVERMLEVAEVGPSDTLIDPGAGTGAILFRAARERGARSIGVELDPLRVLVLRLRRYFGGPRERVEVRFGDLFRVDYRPATVVAVFLWPGAMSRLKPILESQLRAGARVVSHWHEVPGWKPVFVDPQLKVYLYRWPGVTGGT